MVNVELLVKIDIWDVCFIIIVFFNNRINFEFVKNKKIKNYKYNLFLLDYDINLVIVFLVFLSSLEYN